jgi:enoyl-CoA hydratase/isomerase-like protein
MSLVRVRREGAVAVLTLDRPQKLNALSTEVERDLAAALQTQEVSSSRAVVIEGAGRAFSAGADVTEMREQTPDAILAYYRATGTVYERVAEMPQPTIAAIHGYCLGGGLELAMACDLRVAGRSAVFGLPEIELGILPSSGGTLRLVRALGAARTTELVLSRRDRGRRRRRTVSARDRARRRPRRAAAAGGRRDEACDRRRGRVGAGGGAADRAARVRDAVADGRAPGCDADVRSLTVAT